MFEEIVRRNIDPGLLEWAQGDAFRARVFPIPALGDKRIVVAYEQSLAVEADGTRTLRVPLDHAQALARLRARVTVNGAAGTRVTSSHGPDLVIDGETGRARFEITGENALADHDLVLRIAPPAPQPVVLVEATPDGVFFLARVPAPRDERVERPAAKRIGVVWDASRSRAGLECEHPAALLAAYLEALAEDVEVVLEVFSDRPWFTETYRNDAAGRARLQQRLGSLRPDGGTSFASVNFQELARQVDEILVFSDGLDTLEQQLPEGIDVPVFALQVFAPHDGATGSQAALRKLACSGAVIRTRGMAVEDVVARLRTVPRNPIGVEYNGEPVADAEFPDVTGGDWLEVRGRLPGTTLMPQALVVLVSDGAGSVERVSLGTGCVRSVSGGVLQRAWAQARVARLMVNRLHHRDEIAAIGTENGLVTAFTSLLVLESLADHVRYRIPPRPQWREEYQAAVAQLEEAERASREERLVSLALRWQERRGFCTAQYAFPEPASLARAAEGGSVAGPLIAVGGLDALNEEPVNNSWIVSGITNASGGTEMTVGVLVETLEGISVDCMEDDVSDEGVMGGWSITGVVRTSTVVETFEDPTPDDVQVVTDISHSFGPNDAGDMDEGAIEIIGYSLETAFVGDSVPFRRMSGTPPILIAGGAPDALAIENDTSGIYMSRPSDEPPRASSSGGGVLPRPQPGLKIAPWTHDGPHLAALRDAGGAAYEKYLDLAAEFGAMPAFYLDIADYFLEERKHREHGLRILSNVAELAFADARLLRMLAHRYDELGELDRAEALLRRVREMRPEEPQSHRDLGLLLARRERYAEAIALLEEVVVGDWDPRFPDIDLLVLGELNRIAAEATARTGELHHTLPPSLVQRLDGDLRVVMSWDTDAVDIDLWVTEPSGQRVGYNHSRSQIGGRYARDFTGGYGPEEYLVHKAMPGTYAVQIHFFGDSRASLRGATTVRVELIRNYGRRGEQRTVVTRRLRSDKQWLTVGELEF